MASHLHLDTEKPANEKIEDPIDREIAELPNIDLPRKLNPETDRQHKMGTLANCEYVLAHHSEMSDEQCHAILKRFDGKFLKVKIEGDRILVWDPQNPNHHLQSVKKRLVEICQANRKDIVDLFKRQEMRRKEKGKT